jgi:hypothetical protein
MFIVRSAVMVGALLILFACGGSGSPTTPLPPSNPYVFTITTVGVSPKELTVPQGTRVLFINNDSRRRNMTSDPHPEHDICPEINNVGLLNPGQMRETGNLVVVRTCGFHDHDDPDNVNVRGRIVIQ